MEKLPDSCKTVRDALAKLEREEICLLYQQYSEWGRHLHTLVWIAASFGVGISLGGMTLLEKLNRRQFTGLGVAGLVILYICHRLAESNKAQVANNWRFINAIEVHWGVRDATTNPSGPLMGFRPGETAGNTRGARVMLMWACGLAWIVAIIVKITMST